MSLAPCPFRAGKKKFLLERANHIVGVCVSVCVRLDIGFSPSGRRSQVVTNNQVWHDRRRGAPCPAEEQWEGMGFTDNDRAE